MPRQRRRIVLTTVVICLALISVPLLLMWPQTRMERLNRRLIAAIRVLDTDTVEDALKQGASPDTRSNPNAPSVYVQRIQQWFRRDTMSTPEVDTALNEALSARNDAGSRTDDPTRTKTRIVKALLDRGANVNYQYRMSNPPLISDPPLVAASRDCPIEVVRLLLDFKADINARTHSGNTALIEAALHGRTDIVQLLLLQKSVKVDATDNFGMTALMCAAKNSYVKTEEVLLQHHADVKLKSSIGWTALKYAKLYGPEASVQLLKKYNATE